MKAVVAAFNQEKALVGAFSVITNLRIAFVWISSHQHGTTGRKWPPPPRHRGLTSPRPALLATACLERGGVTQMIIMLQTVVIKLVASRHQILNFSQNFPTFCSMPTIIVDCCWVSNYLSLQKYFRNINIIVIILNRRYFYWYYVGLNTNEIKLAIILC